MSFPPVVAAALSGATVRQLSYWRSARTTEPLLAPELHRPRSRVSYSFRDVVALRTFVYLRSRQVPLQRVRKAVRNLRQMGADEHLAAYTLVAMERDVAWLHTSDVAVMLTKHPGQGVIAEMIDILGPFTNMQHRDVVPLHSPAAGVGVDQDVRGGYPVIEGTRVPYDAVAALVDDGVDPADVAAFYPSVDADAARGAVEFARYVDQYRDTRIAA